MQVASFGRRALKVIVPVGLTPPLRTAVSWTGVADHDRLGRARRDAGRGRADDDGLVGVVAGAGDRVVVGVAAVAGDPAVGADQRWA